MKMQLGDMTNNQSNHLTSPHQTASQLYGGSNVLPNRQHISHLRFRLFTVDVVSEPSFRHMVHVILLGIFKFNYLTVSGPNVANTPRNKLNSRQRARTNDVPFRYCFPFSRIRQCCRHEICSPIPVLYFHEHHQDMFVHEIWVQFGH